jgi:hypothetical protein
VGGPYPEAGADEAGRVAACSPVKEQQQSDAYGALLFACGMRCHNYTAPHLFGPYRNLSTIVEAALGLTFRALLELIWREVQTCLDERMIQDAIFFATGHEREPSEIRTYSSRAILSIEPEQGAGLWELVRGEIARDRRKRLSQLRTILPAAAVSKTAEPLVAGGLTNDRACPHDLPPLAPRVARSTHVIQPAKGRRQLFGLGQGALTGRFSRAINIKEDPRIPSSIR